MLLFAIMLLRLLVFGSKSRIPQVPSKALLTWSDARAKRSDSVLCGKKGLPEIKHDIIETEANVALLAFLCVSIKQITLLKMDQVQYCCGGDLNCEWRMRKARPSRSTRTKEL